MKKSNSNVLRLVFAVIIVLMLQINIFSFVYATGELELYDPNTGFVSYGGQDIVGYTNITDELIIPEKIGEMEVKKIRSMSVYPSDIFIGEEYNGLISTVSQSLDDAYTSGKINELQENKSNVKRVVIPDTVEEIGDQCFNGFENIKEIELPDSLTYIGEEAFPDYLDIGYVEDGVRYISGIAYKCENVPDDGVIRFKDGTKEITPGFFKGNAEINTVYIPDSIKIIRSGVFENCANLKKVIIPSSVEEIDATAFSFTKTKELTFVTEEGTEAYRFAETKNINIELPDSSAVGDDTVDESSDESEDSTKDLNEENKKDVNNNSDHTSGSISEPLKTDFGDNYILFIVIGAIVVLLLIVGLVVIITNKRKSK